MEFYRKGSFLERQVEGIFRRAGFKTEINSKRYSFESDVIASHKNFNIIVECKEYNTYLNISSLLYQWESKKRKSGADRVILVVVGIKTIPKGIEELAKELDVILWMDKQINHLSSIETKDELRNEINRAIKFDIEELKIKRRQNNIKFLKKTIIFFGLVIMGLIIFKSESISLETKFLLWGIFLIIFFVWLMIDPKRAKISYNILKGINKGLNNGKKDWRNINRNYKRKRRRK
jgi:hypothetical protein